MFKLFKRWLAFLDSVEIAILKKPRDLKPDLRPESCQRGEHDMRSIAAPFVLQCRVKSCGIVQYRGEVPDGMKDWVELMTSEAAASDPIRSATDYRRIFGGPLHWCADPACLICNVVPGGIKELRHEYGQMEDDGRYDK